MSPGVVVLLVAFALFVGYLIGRQNRPPKTDQAWRKPMPSSFLQSPLHGLSTQEREELRQLINANQRIEAIKRCRQITGCGLKEAKDIVEQLD
jgi:Ribosomal protein L7/L12 C-terminal domain